MKAYVNTLNEHRIFQSMSRKGNCHDNSVMENFFGIMKQEMYYGVVYYSFDELKDAIDKYIKYYVSVKVLASFTDSKIVIKYPYKDSWGCTVPQNSL